MKKPTSKDVAKLANVSQATVSMILNKKDNVSFAEETVEKVLLGRETTQLWYAFDCKSLPWRKEKTHRAVYTDDEQPLLPDAQSGR